MIIPNRNKTTIIEGEGNDLSMWPIDQLPYKSADGTIQGSGMRVLSSGSLLAPVGFAVESGSIDFGDVIRLSESAGFLAFENMVDNIKYQLLDYATPRNAPASKPYYFYLKEAERRVDAQANGSITISTNPLTFNYTTQFTARTNSLIFTATGNMTNVRLRITDKKSGVAVKYFPSKSSWTTGKDGTSFGIGENVLDFLDTAVIFQAGTDIVFDIQADQMFLAGTNGMPKFSGYIQEGIFIGVADQNDLDDIQQQISEIGEGFTGSYADLTDVPATFAPSAHTHTISEVDGLQGELSSVNTDINYLKSENSGLASVAKTGSYSDLINKPVIPTATNQIENNSGYITIDHKHPISDVTGLQTAIDSKLSTTANVPASQVTGLSSVAVSGSYTDLTNKPVFPTKVSSFENDSAYITLAQVPAVSISWADVQNKPVTFPSSSHSHSISDVANLQATLDSKRNSLDAIAYSSLTGLPSLFSGAYNDLTGKPTLFSGSYADLINKPVYATVASTGSYSDLSNKPVIPTVNYPVTSVAGRTGAIVLSAADVGGLSSVATSGAYSSLTGLPTIPAAQVNSDWAATSGVSQILNKPVLFSGSWNDLTNKPTSFTPSAHTHVIGDITNLQTTLDTKITSATLPITRRVDNSVVARTKVKYYTAVSDSTSSVWTVTTGTDFTEILDVQVQPVSTANTIAGIRQASLNAYTTTSTALTGLTYGNSVLTTVLIGLGANTLTLLPNTTVRVRVEGVGA